MDGGEQPIPDIDQSMMNTERATMNGSAQPFFILCLSLLRTVVCCHS